MKIKRYVNTLKKAANSNKPKYIDYCELPIDEKLVLIEGGQGSNINGNMFAMLRELRVNPRWAEYKPVFVVTPKTHDSAAERMAFYGFNDVVLCNRDTDSYCKYLATAKYLMTDNSFSPYFMKREEQVFLNTWHGTPLKTLGKSDKSNLASLANIQKNYLMSDYALFPNEFTKDVFMNDYDLRDIYKGNYIIANYPRNYVFYDKAQGISMKTRLGYDGKRVFAYMPTWRGTGRKADTAKQIANTKAILDELDEKLGDDEIVLVNLHFLLSTGIDCTEYKHIEYFNRDYDTYEVLNACDGLITDYSSVFFDYAVTGKKVILYAYDKEEYLSTRGTYMPFEELPFPILETVDDVVAEMKKPAAVNEAFLEKFCPNGSERSCEKIFELMVTGKTDLCKVEKLDGAGENVCLIYAGQIATKYFENITDYINDNPGYKYVIAYRRNLSQKRKDFIVSLDSSISTLGTVTAYLFKWRELLPAVLYWLLGKFGETENMARFFRREAARLFYSFTPAKVVDFSSGNFIMAGILSKLSGIKAYVTHGDYTCSRKREISRREYVTALETEKGFVEEDYAEIETRRYLERYADEESAHYSFGKCTSFKNFSPFYFKNGRNLVCINRFKIKTGEPIRLCDAFIAVADKVYVPGAFKKVKRRSTHFSGFYKLTIPFEDVMDLPATNPVCFCYRTKYGKLVKKHIVFSSPLRNRCLGLRSPMVKDAATETVAIFRQSRSNRLSVYVRSLNVTDSFKESVKMFFAFCLSLLWHPSKKKAPVLLYEKNSSKYEESASVVFEELVEKGYKNARFIITRDYEFLDRVPEKYRKNLVWKYSFEHYLLFFKCRTFIGTEALVHAIDLKTFNPFALKKISSKNLNYVFLQHGVMYMVSLDSESRKMFKRKSLRGKYRVVVSSQAEADHFTTLGRHREDDLYICGLPKFDRNTHNPNADKIVIMPTWRPWEINEARTDFLETPYFKMIMRIYNAVPQELKSKVIILPHPLIVNELSKLSANLSDKIVLDARYDDILKETAVLITDYSSIAYDAFYRGVNVMFWWEEKDYCMQSYGASTKLMLNEENVFGDTFLCADGFAEALTRNYRENQSELYKERYSHLVEFHDSKNTERLISFLEADEII